MIFYLDTNICIYALKGSFPMIASWIQRKTPVDIKIPSMVQAELFLGGKKSQRPEETLEKMQKFLSPFEIISFDHRAAEVYADIRTQLEKQGKIVGPNDLIIAATVLANHGTLVTHNVREFSRISHLKTEDWTKG